MKYDEIEQKVQSYRWLEGIAEEYRKMIDRIHAEKEYFRVEKIAYTARGDMRYLDLNCHRTIPYHYIADGLQDGKFPKVPGRRRGTRGFPAASRQRPRESFFNASRGPSPLP